MKSAKERLLKNLNILQSHYLAREKDGTLDATGRRFLNDSRREKNELIRALAAEDQAKGPAAQALRHSRFISLTMASKVKGRKLTQIRAKRRKRNSVNSVLIGIVPSQELLESFAKPIQQAYSDLFDSIRDTATLKGV